MGRAAMDRKTDRSKSKGITSTVLSFSPAVVCGMLLVLLGLTVMGSYVFTGLVGLTFAMAMAVMKSALVFWNYMHLEEVSPLSRIAALGAAFWFLIFLLFMSADYMTRPIS
jgi:cytochrome c oxidase subunit IV